MVTWNVFKNHLLKVGQTQNRGTMALQMLITFDLLYILSCMKTRTNRNSMKIAFD